MCHSQVLKGSTNEQENDININSIIYLFPQIIKSPELLNVIVSFANMKHNDNNLILYRCPYCEITPHYLVFNFIK